MEILRCAQDDKRGTLPSALHPSLLAILATLALFLSTSVSVAAETRPHYDLRMSVAWADGTVDVTQTTSFRNDTGTDLSEVVFQVVPAYFGAFTLISARVGGIDASTLRDGTVLQVDLSSPLSRNETAQIELRYTLKVPTTGDRFGRGNGIMALGNFFPVLSVYRDGWDRHQYVNVGDAFFTEVADFDVALTSDVPLTVAATGPGEGQGNAWQFHAEDVRDFAMTLSDRYQVRSRDVSGIHFSAYATSSGRLDAYLDAAVKSVDWYSSHFGPYPYPTFSVVEIYAANSAPTAMEYPGLIMVYGPLGTDGGGVGSYSEYVVAHEVGHQWFYSQVGDDEVHDPWLDEAFATYTDMLFLRDTDPKIFQTYWARNGEAYRNRVAMGTDKPVSTSVYDYSSDAPYFDIVYRKGAIFLDKLRSLAGDEVFFNLLREYVATYSNKVAEPRAFLDLAYRRIGSAVPPLAAQYFSYGAFVDGTGYQLDVQWPDILSPDGQANVAYTSSFNAVYEKVWLDDRLLYSGPATGSLPISLDGVEPGDYILQLDLTDAQGALYQRAKRVKCE